MTVEFLRRNVPLSLQRLRKPPPRQNLWHPQTRIRRASHPRGHRRSLHLSPVRLLHQARRRYQTTLLTQLHSVLRTHQRQRDRPRPRHRLCPPRADSHRLPLPAAARAAPGAGLQASAAPRAPAAEAVAARRHPLPRLAPAKVPAQPRSTPRSKTYKGASPMPPRRRTPTRCR